MAIEKRAVGVGAEHHRLCAGFQIGLGGGIAGDHVLPVVPGRTVHQADGGAAG